METILIDGDVDTRVSDHLRNIGISSFDTDGLMRHILDCIGTLNVRIKEDTETCDSIRRVFVQTAISMLESVADRNHAYDGTASPYLLSCFPDATKKRDGRSWLPLHWASVLDTTTNEDLFVISHDRPLVLQRDHDHSEPSEMEDACDGVLPLHCICSARLPLFSNVKMLLKMYPDAIRCHDKRGWLPLHWAAYNCYNEEIVDYLLDKFPNGAFMPTYKGQLPFQLTTHNMNFSIVMKVLDANKDALTAIDNEGNTALHDATRHCNNEAATRLLSLCPELSDYRNFKGELPIHRVFQFVPRNSMLATRQLETIKILLESHPGTAQFPSDEDGLLPLHLAVKFDCTFETIQYVYNMFPSGSLQYDRLGHLPLHYDCSKNDEIQKLLLGAHPTIAKHGATSSFSRFSI